LKPSIKGQIQSAVVGFQGVDKAVARMAWGKGPIIGPDFTLAMLRGWVYSRYTSLDTHTQSMEGKDESKTVCARHANIQFLCIS
jgi:hypothetical protein